jgi:flagellar basal-body rod modification protein FlgD
MIPVSSSTPSTNQNSPTGTNSIGQLTNESTFLQLLVAQIKNQDPLNPTDSIQFIGQLVQFSQLEQLLNLNQSVGTLVTDASGAASTQPGSSAAPPSTPSAPSNPSTPSSGNGG